MRIRPEAYRRNVTLDSSTGVLLTLSLEHLYYWRSAMTRRVRIRTIVVPRAQACPDCGGPLVHAEGCVTCPVCGYSACS